VPLAIRKAVQYHHAKNYARELCRDKNIVKFVDDEPVTIVAGNPNGGLHKAQLLRKAQSTRVTSVKMNGGLQKAHTSRLGSSGNKMNGGRS